MQHAVNVLGKCINNHNGNAKGVQAIDKDGNKVQIVEVLGYDAVGNINKVRGKGLVYLPMEYMDNSGDVRNAIFTVVRPDTGEKCVMYIKQA